MVRGTVNLKNGDTVFIVAENMLEALQTIRDRYWWQMDRMDVWTSDEGTVTIKPIIPTKEGDGEWLTLNG